MMKKWGKTARAIVVAVSASAVVATAATNVAALQPNQAPTVAAYKRDPMPVFSLDDAGKFKLDGKIPLSELPKAGDPSARIVSAVPNYVAVQAKDKVVWMRSLLVDHAGDLEAVCVKEPQVFAQLTKEAQDMALGECKDERAD